MKREGEVSRLVDIAEGFAPDEVYEAFARVLTNAGPLPEGAVDAARENAGLKNADARLYGNFWRDSREVLARGRDQGRAPQARRMLDLGGGAGEKAGFREGFEYTLMDIDPQNGSGEDVIVHDINKPFPVEDESFDLVFCNQVFEHLEEPWVTASEVGRILKPGGISLISTVFSYRYHPYPGDFWRFTHAGLTRLMERYGKLSTLVSKYELTHRRDDRRGALGHPDEVHVDWLGGFRENWFVYHIGQKPE